jgi:signal transduction histidine kinase
MSMTARRGISRRLWREFLLQAVYISIAAIVSVFAVGVLMEDVLIKEALRGEAEYFWSLQSRDPAAALPDTRNLTVFEEGVGVGVPDWLRGLDLGFHRQTEPVPSLAYIAEKDGRRLYLVFDIRNVNRLVAFFGLVPLALVLVVIYLSLYRAYKVSRRAVSPVIGLARQVQRLDPARPNADLFSAAMLPADPDEETELLSSAMRGLTERLTDFVERERNFTRDASHELRSPLTVMKIAANMLLKDERVSEKGRESAQRIRDAVADMEELTEAFLLLARETDQSLPLQWVSVNEIAGAEVERARLTSENSNVTIDIRDEGPLLVPAPPKVLASVIGNVLRNGLSYTDAGKVSVNVGPDRVTIVDTGPGMPPDQVEKVFKPYYRAGRRRGGHGVGLTIVKRLCDRFGWPVTIDSTPGEGTRVTVVFPDSRRQEPAGDAATPQI